MSTRSNGESGNNVNYIAYVVNQCILNTNKQQNNQLKSSICPNSDWNVRFWTDKKRVCACVYSLDLPSFELLQDYAFKGTSGKKESIRFSVLHITAQREWQREFLSVSVLRLKISHMQPSFRHIQNGIHQIQLQSSEFIRKIA